MSTILPPDLDRVQDRAELIGIGTALFALRSLVSRLPVGAGYTGARVIEPP